ncbi:hypothetical protein AVEN_94608-1 [Araneus ventricosus]|uniref:Uncharacterized protein n=1 Tax=Araneus ventricosus TaxID=182803 RepID=A0A4Y2SBM1_ARAVE|nr:hypothetical protein AVEN_94608-1 [Araneus ventricosus]
MIPKRQFSLQLLHHTRGRKILVDFNWYGTMKMEQHSVVGIYPQGHQKVFVQQQSGEAAVRPGSEVSFYFSLITVTSYFEATQLLF